MSATTTASDAPRVGLARVSTNDQDAQLQLDALHAAGCIKIFEEKVSTRKVPILERKSFVAALDYLRDGDDLVVWRLDRLGRDTLEILQAAELIHARGIGLVILTGTMAGRYTPNGEGKFFFTIMAAFAELERDIIHERTMAGLQAAREQGRVGGRPTRITPDVAAVVLARLTAGDPVATIAEVVGVGRSTLYDHFRDEIEAARDARARRNGVATVPEVTGE